MKIDTLFSTLAALPAFGGRVTVASTLESALEAVKPFAAMPCGVLYGLIEEATTNEMGIGSGPRHRVTVRVRLLIMHRDASDARGEAAMQGLEAVRHESLSALLGLVPDNEYEPLEYRGGQLAYAQAGTIIWMDEWTTRYTLLTTRAT